MKSNHMATAIGMVDDDLIIEAVEAKAVKHKSIWLRMGIAAVCAASVLGAFVVGAYAYYTPTSYVSLDVNPSIEYALNTFGRVLSVKGVNDDGEDILEDIGLTRLQNKAIDKAIRETINAIAKLGYFPEDSEGGVVIAVSDKKAEKAEKLSEQLKEMVEQATQEEQLDVDVESMAVGEERVEEARSLGVTPGKLNLVEKLKESAEDPDDIDIEAWLNKPVKDIMKQTKANKALSKGKESDTDDDSDEESDVALDSGKPGNVDKGNSANKSDKAASKDKSSNGTNNSSNSTNKSDNAADKKDNSANASNSSNGNNGSNQSNNASNNGQSKKLYATIESQDDDASETSDTSSNDDASETSEKDTDKGNSSDKANKSNSSEKSNSSNKSDSTTKSNSSSKSKGSKK